MTEWREESHKSYFFALSLLIHLALFVTLLKVTNADRLLFEKIMPSEHTLEKQDDRFDSYTPAALKSRASNFGAPVHFAQEPEIQNNDNDGSDEQAHGGLDIQTPEQEEQPVVQANMPIVQQEEPKQEAEQKTEDASEVIESKPFQQSLMLEKSPEALQSEKSEPIKEEQKKIEKQQMKPPVQKPVQQQLPRQKIVRKKIAQRSLGNSSRSATPIKKQLTLADLAEGFINTLNRGGNDWLDRDGDDKKRPDFEDLKYLSYTKKVVWYMQNEWRATQNKLSIQLNQEYILSLIITFLKDGTVGNINVVHPSGCPELDEFLIKGIRNAGPYPPLPAHFKSDSFDLPLNIVNARERSQPWQMYLSRSR